MKAKVVVLGASGYSGTELVKALAAHPAVEIAALGGDSKAGLRLSQVDPSVAGLDLPDLEALSAEQAADRGDFIFLALPHTQSMQWAPILLDRGRRVVDLSGDFRLTDPAVYGHFYGQAHTAPERIKGAVYGLPELNREAIRGARLVANPGCYPTVSILALLPLVERPGLVDDRSMVVDAKSGYSGGGRKLAQGAAFEKLNRNFSAYKAGGVHQHIPEMEQALSQAAGRDLKLSFTPHLLDIERGILATCYVSLNKEMDAAALWTLYRERYDGEPFVHVEKEGVLPDLKQVQGGNDCRIGLSLDSRTGRAIVVAAEDNLGKGAALQAVQNMNLMLGLDETAGLPVNQKGVS